MTHTEPSIKEYLIENIGGKEIPIQIPDVAWSGSAVEKILGFLRLLPNWDGYGAPSLKIDCILMAIDVITFITQENTPEPTIFPTSDEGVQIEWHTDKAELEVEVTHDLKLLVLFDDPHGNKYDWEMSLYSSPDLQRIINCVRQLA